VKVGGEEGKVISQFQYSLLSFMLCEVRDEKRYVPTFVLPFQLFHIKGKLG
jgi:hypothetical protein